MRKKQPFSGLDPATKSSRNIAKQMFRLLCFFPFFLVHLQIFFVKCNRLISNEKSRLHL